MKNSVMDRLRHAERWFASNGPQWHWMRELVVDAQRELESESGSLWCQWVTGPASHIRVFVTGEMGPHEIDVFMEYLKLSRSYAAKGDKGNVWRFCEVCGGRLSESAPSVDAVDPADGVVTK